MTEETVEALEPRILIFVGTLVPDDEEAPIEGDYLYAELQMTGISLHLGKSTQEVEYLEAESFLGAMEALIKTAKLVSSQLFVDIELDETIEDLACELSYNLKYDLYPKVKEMLEKKDDE